MTAWLAGILHLIWMDVSHQASYSGRFAISTSVHGEGVERRGMQSKYDMKCSSSAYKKLPLTLQISTGSSKPREENLSITTMRRDWTPNQELLQWLEKQDLKRKIKLPETHGVSGFWWSISHLVPTISQLNTCNGPYFELIYMFLPPSNKSVN